MWRCSEPLALWLRHEDWNRLASVQAVNLKIVVQGEHHCLRMQFCQPDQAGVGERHRDVCGSLNELFQSSPFGNYDTMMTRYSGTQTLQMFRVRGEVGWPAQ